MNKRMQNDNPYIGVQKEPVLVTSTGKIPADLVKETRALACKRIAVKKVASLIPQKFFEAMEHNQQLASCCRHPENHDIEAWRSKPDEYAPDIYIFFCSCGRQHRRFCIGGGDERPHWEFN